MQRQPKYEGYLFDLDGTIYLGNELIAGAGQTVAWLRAAGRRVLFLSNKPLQPSSVYAEKLTRLGIPATPNDVLNSTQSLIHYLTTHHSQHRIYVVGEPSFITELTQQGFHLTTHIQSIDVVVVAFDRTLDYGKLNIAHQAILRGATFLATNADPSCPVAGGDIPDCAGIIAFLEATTGRKVDLVLGKPSRHMLEAAATRIGVPLERCLMTGDRLGTDMLMGYTAGMDTALVLTGATHRQALETTERAPTFILESVVEIP